MSNNITSILSMGKITNKEAKKLIEESNKQIIYKVSEKNAISFYGIRKLPITIYLDEITKLKTVFTTDNFNTFLNNNKTSLIQR